MENECWANETFDETDESIWLYAAAHNLAFASLYDASENIYTLEDGKPFDAEA